MSDAFPADSVTWVTTDTDLEHLLTALDMAEEVTLDLETTGLDEHAVTGGPTNGGYPARIVLASFTLPDTTTWLLPLSHPDSPFLGRWRRVLRSVTVTLRDLDLPVIGHNVKFDLRWIKAHVGVDLSPLLAWDTQVSSHLLDENTSTRLKDRAPATFGVPAWDDFSLGYPGAAEHVPLIDLGLYAARDTYWTWRLAEHHRALMLPATEPVYGDEIEHARLGLLATWCAMPTSATLAAIEQRGIVLDTDWTRARLDTERATVADLTKSLATRYPTLDPNDASFAPTSTWFQAWAAAAVDAGDLTVAELTPRGKSRWSKGVLTRQARAGSAAALGVLELRQAAKRAEYLASWLGYTTPLGTIHTTYHDASVVTGRTSSSGPNMQQVTASLRPAFVPSAGHVFADLDYSQIELRVAAFISRCEPMLDAFRRGDDLHTLLARRITGRDQVTSAERQAGKSANFGLLYGMGPYGFREYAETVYGVTFTVPEAVRIHRAFFDVWDGLAEWQLRVAHKARQTGQITSPIGRVRRLPGVFDHNDATAAAAERAAVNAPVQGFASDLMQIAAASIEGRIPGFARVSDARIVATVHDSILVEVPADNPHTATTTCISRMLTVGDVLAHMDCTLDVPLAVTAKIGTRWGLADIATLT